MGILNVTPDSFSGDGLADSTDRAVRRGLEFVSDGADVLDIGGESTRPGAQPVPEAEELRRVLPVLQALSAEVDVPLSVDTCKAEVARQACAAGATIINDISGLNRGTALAEVAAETGAGLILMHMLGTPRTMQHAPQYVDVVGDICDSLRESLRKASRAGVRTEQTMVDPGFGFGKTVAHNLELLRRLAEFRSLGRPVLLGTSRKSTIGTVLDLPVDERLEGTAATVAVGIVNGADMVRVHDVKSMSRVARMTDAIVRP
jgi:dihydropteroate synthase